jgi:hypothetical protein
MVTGFLSRGKAAGAWRGPRTTSSAEVKERAELYSTYGLSWPVLGWTISLPLSPYLWNIAPLNTTLLLYCWNTVLCKFHSTALLLKYSSLSYHCTAFYRQRATPLIVCCFVGCMWKILISDICIRLNIYVHFITFTQITNLAAGCIIKPVGSHAAHRPRVGNPCSKASTAFIVSIQRTICRT